MTAKEDKKTPARVGRVPGLILAQRCGRPSLAGGVLPYLPAARQRAQVVRILGKMVITKRVSVTGHYINSRPSVQAWMGILLLAALREPHERNSPKVLPEMSPPFQPQALCYPGESAAHQQQRQ